MKFPGKRLIVEYKNRRSHKSTNSLWGDINLKEITREVESDLSLPEYAKQNNLEKTVTDPNAHAPYATQISPVQADEKPTIVTEGETSAGPLPEDGIKPASATVRQKAASRRKRNAPVGIKAATLKMEHEGGKLHDAATVSAANTLPLSSSGSVSLSPQAKSIIVVTGRSQKPPTVSNMIPAPTAKPTIPKVRGSKQLTRRPITGSHASHLKQDPHLNALEVENRRLKLLLVEHLRAENARLEQMILRADQVFDVTDESA
ncbi:hypothetical protein [Brucella grignonensis]|uniref:hypothetical protein n=1 Tax=Brucella grignonensis TaxID=94627 RepID=UPI000B998180|nr:hypothetical protein [Brucella grignonensis]